MPNKFANLLDLTYELESSGGRDPDAYKVGKKGALGGYQMTEGAFNAVKKANPNRWGSTKFADLKSDELGREAAGEYYDILTNELAGRGIAPTRMALLMNYHSGGKSMMSLGKEGKAHMAKALALTGGLE